MYEKTKVRLHFSLKASEINEQCEKWAKLHSTAYDTQTRNCRGLGELGPLTSFEALKLSLLSKLKGTPAASTQASLFIPPVVVNLSDADGPSDLDDFDYDENDECSSDDSDPPALMNISGLAAPLAAAAAAASSSAQGVIDLTDDL